MAESEDVDQNLFPSKADLQEAEGMWNDGTEEANKPRPLGNQVADIVEATLGRSGNGRLQIHYHLQIKGGQFNDEELDKYDGMGSPPQTAITQQQLQRTGIDTSKVNMKTLPGFLVQLAGKRMQINCKKNGDFYNITFIKPLTESLTQEHAATAGNNSGGRRQTAAAGGKPRRSF